MTPAEEQFHSGHPVTLFALIAERLEQLGLQHWTAVVFGWLARYDGLTHCYFEDEEPSPSMAVLRAVNELPPGASDNEVAHSLAMLEFLAWRVKHPETGDRWDPLACALYDFLGPDRLPVCWKWEGTYPSEASVEEWLLKQLPSP